ncbi:topoisomerase 1-associated factor 1 [Trichomonascus vanleenenianus]|uniref:Tof1p n=1 Tax=Trichomonascus vanleenenianus TaxID=2268995 RepID=UPI003ECACF2A
MSGYRAIEDYFEEEQPVDPEIKAYITNLVSSLGGPDVTAPGRPYKLGDDALACLRDLKTWIKAYDERMGRWDVARAISETSLLSVEIPEILTKWELGCEKGKSSKFYDRIALACLELLVPLTWPLVIEANVTTKNQLKHVSYLQQAQFKYKRAFLTHPKKVFFRAIVRLAVPILKTAAKDRSTRDDGILKLVVYFFRNVLAIEPTSSARCEFPEDVSRNATLSVLNDQKVLEFILMLAGEIESFRIQDTAVMECVFHMLKGIPPSLLFPDKSRKDGNSQAVAGGSDLKSLLAKEKDIRKSIQRKAPTRHHRFGTMVSLITPEHVRYAVSGSSGLSDNASSLYKLDANKKWHSRTEKKIDDEWTCSTSLSSENQEMLRSYVADFLESAFNPLFLAVRTLVEQDVERLLEIHKRYYLYLVGWFLEAQRNKSMEDYGYVGEVLNQQSFVVVLKVLRDYFDTPTPDYPMVYAAMSCFLQILYIVKALGETFGSEQQEIADSMKSRLFYEEAYLDLLVQLTKKAYRHTFTYLKLTVELTHVAIKMLQGFSQEHTALFVKSRRRRTTKAHKNADEEEYDINPEEESRQVTSERKFEFARFQNKYYNVHTIKTYVTYLKTYKELTNEEIKRGIAFIHRFFAVNGSRGHFYNLEFMRLLQALTDSREGIPHSFSCRKDVERFMSYYVNKLRNALSDTPSLYVELLFEKIPDHLFYFDHGHAEAPKPIKMAAEWEFKDVELTLDQKVGYVVAALIDDQNLELVKSLSNQLTNVVSKWKDEGPSNFMLKHDSEDHEKSMFKNGKYRLLLSLVGFQTPDGERKHAVLLRTSDIVHVEEALSYIQKYLEEPVQIDEPGKVASDFIQKKAQEKVPRKARSRQKGEEDDDDLGSGYQLDGFIDDSGSDDSAESDDDLRDENGNEIQDELMARQLARASKRKSKKSRPKKKKQSKDEEEPQRRRKAKGPTKDELRMQKYKSEAFVHDSDDESDEERDRAFFESEERLRTFISEKFANGEDAMPNKGVAASSLTVSEPVSHNVGATQVEGRSAEPLSSDDAMNDSGGDESENDAGEDAGELISAESSDTDTLDKENKRSLGDDELAAKPVKRAKRIVIDDDDE